MPLDMRDRIAIWGTTILVVALTTGWILLAAPTLIATLHGDPHAVANLCGNLLHPTSTTHVEVQP